MLKKNTTGLALAAAMLLGAATQPLFAQEQDAAIEAIHDEIRALKRGAEEAFNEIGSSGRDGNIEPLLQYVHDDVVLVAMNGDTSVGKQGIRDYFVDKMAGPEPTVASVHHTFTVAALTTLYGDDTGVAYGDTVGTYELTNGMSFTVDAYWTATMVKEEGKWLLASFQFAPSIFDNPLLDEAKGMVYRIAAIAGVIGLIIGFLLARSFRRRSENA
ncbi:MAG: DUF4440 domain-containing protein [Woeseiaceae bacterium]|nr:DUF4440 domain-containing protein [Woeseiaceae bacterium]